MTFRHTLTYPLCCCIDEQSGEPQTLEGPERWTFCLCVFLQQSIYEELPEAVSSIFQIEQEDLLEWGAMGEENLAFKSEEALDIVQLEGFSKPLESTRPSIDVRSGRRSTLKVSLTKHYCQCWEHVELCKLGMCNCEEVPRQRLRLCLLEGRTDFQGKGASGLFRHWPPFSVYHLMGVGKCSPRTKPGWAW